MVDPAFQIGQQPVEWHFAHSVLEPQAVGEPVVNCIKGRQHVEAYEHSDLPVIGCCEGTVQDLQQCRLCEWPFLYADSYSAFNDTQVYIGNAR